MRWFAALGAVLCTSSGLWANFTLNPLFSDNAVLQQGIEIPVWGTAKPGAKVTVTLTPEGDARDAGQTVTADDKGRWIVRLPARKASEKLHTLIAESEKAELSRKDLLIGEVWICSGQSNMQWIVNNSSDPDTVKATAKFPQIRFFSVPRMTSREPQTTVQGSWTVCSPETVGNFSAVGYHFGRSIHQARKVPVGLINASFGGMPAEAFTRKEALDAEPSLRYYHEKLNDAIKNYDPAKAQTNYEKALAKYKEDAEKAKAEKKPVPKPPAKPTPPGTSPNTPSGLWNAMIAPLVPYGTAGAIWYQGESNAGRAYEYRTLFPVMIEDWRKQWGQKDFGFYFVQLAPYLAISPTPQDSNWAELREAQLLTLRLPQTGMAVITDTTNPATDQKDIHPKNKAPVGERLALLARKITYGENLVAMGPVYKAVKFTDSEAILTFENVGGGLEMKGEKLTGFTIAGPDGKFHNAEAKIVGETVVVSSGQVTKPVAVRFGWANYPVVNLFNKEGLPATPFRTDNFPITTQPKTALKPQ